ncbi:c-type cytochrome [Flavobacterium zepuense]|uniref:C-type cytochrome n=1 Tax=Flavobacterium zepuense TaxID=2593302 RepID=A0A552UV65_9FLAO|nr:c-type cytochrome [Flavobacterium zepuense]TRW22123.1 c-type cytochrome [Flavobacterium zepuense]
MKQLSTLLLAILLFSCKSEKEEKEPLYQDTNSAIAEGTTSDLSPEAQLGQEVFDGKGNCYSCHKPDQKVVGPSIQEIANIYKTKKGNMVSFLKGNEDPIVDPEMFETMKTNLILTKTFTDEELKGLEAYFYSYTNQK